MNHPIFRKAQAFFIQPSPDGKAKLLVYTTLDGSLRFPGGTVNDGEDLLAGLYREVFEETGINDFKFLRKLGVHRYYKPDVDIHVERHDFLLLASRPLPANGFTFTVQSYDKDDGMVFDYRWIGVEECQLLNWEFKDLITPEYIPEFFS